MDLIFHESALHDVSTGEALSPEQRNLFARIIHNDNSRILLSAPVARRLQEVRDSLNSDAFDQLCKMLIDRGEIVETASDSQHPEASYLNLIKSSSSAITLVFASEWAPSDIENFAAICNMRKADRPSVHWTLAKLASVHPDPVHLTNSDFSADEDIRHLFSTLLSLWKRKNDAVFIFDRFTNTEHDLLEGAKQFTRVHFFTKKLKKETDYEFGERVKKLKNKFKNAFVFTPHSRFDMHSRNVMIGDLVISPDNDLINTTAGDEADWRLAIIVSPEEASRLTSISMKFRRVA